MTSQKYMKRSIFLLISALGSFGFGAMMFFVPAFASHLLGLELTPAITSLLRGMGGLIIGTGAMNFSLRNIVHEETIKALLWTNIITHLFGLSADIWGILDGALTTSKIAPIEITHLFIGIGSLIYLLRLKNSSTKPN